MLPSRSTISGQSSALRKSRLEGKPSLLPKPRRPGSIDRQSTEARRPSTAAAGHRSSSAEPRPTYGVRLSREASATKLSVNGRSRSQQGDRYGQSSITPLRSSQYSMRPTTPRTPSEERRSRNWQTSLERALAFVTVKDQRPISNPAWQRAEYARVQEALAARASPGAGGAGMALLRPLTIARFVEITGALLAAIAKDSKISNDNYVAKLPLLSKRLLYPGAVSKSWLKTVNTLHAFPNALAFVAYLLDMVTHIEMAVSDEWLYLDKSELARLRRDYLYKCWIRFQEPDHQFEDLNEEYLSNLKALLGDHQEKMAELQHDIKQLEARLEDESEAAARADEARRATRRDALQAALRTVRSARVTQRASRDEQIAVARDYAEKLRHIDLDIERATAENHQLKQELENQSMSIEERARLLDEVDYASRVQDSKQTLVDEIAKMVVNKETELALWQKKTLDACVHYKQGLIRLSARLPHLAALAVDEKELMGSECGVRVAGAVETLRACSAALGEQRAEHARNKTALVRQRTALLEETRAKISEIKACIERDQRSLETDTEREATDAVAWTQELHDITARMDEIALREAEYERIDKELEFWEKQDLVWRTQLAEMHRYIESYRAQTLLQMEEARAKRTTVLVDGLTKLKKYVQ